MEKRWLSVGLCVVILFVLVASKPLRASESEDAKQSLWERLGGEKNVAKVVADFQKAAGADPKVNATRDGKFKLDEAGKKERQRLFVEFISSVTGGPLKYSGRSMKDSHKGLGITDAEFDASTAHFKNALEKNRVAAADVTEVLKLWNATRKDIVEAKKK
jgi:hemoglobin